jgi:hypothetical protein
MERAIGNDATRKMVTKIASEALHRVAGMAGPVDEQRRADAALDFVVGYIAGIRACGYERQANTLVGEYTPLLGPGFYEALRKLVEEGRRMKWH